ncbi:MAG: hypothetical protein B6D61_04590 [Bacteroidetes bacterium 4484_249]|nr:MAG: hypothetical protein B6D61_04590 [Bacteroidetes bacterium 4484_249]
MKTILHLLLFVIFLQSQLFSQSDLVNVNPDPDGEPWIAGGLRPLTPADYEFLNSLPELKIPDNKQVKLLPVSVDNSEQPYFRPIFSQEGGSCAQASGIGYCFTYEIDFERGVSADILQNQYPTHYTWNFLNGGSGGGSWYFDGWRIIQANGCPNVPDWGGSFAYGGETRWMSGYDEYFNGMHNKVYEIYSINVGTEEGLEVFKNWIYDHLDGSEAGGIACFGAGVSNTFYMTSLPAGTPEAGKAVVVRWDESVNHAMTFVGYNDEIRFDFNNDGQYTNDIDINGDNVIDMKDWEIGGVKLANSWGNSFGNNGFAYTMYKNLAESLDNGGIWSNTIHIIKTKETYSPILTIKTTITHDSRNKLKIVAGVSADVNSDKPENFLSFPCFNYQGGDLYMQGGYTQSDKTIEIGLDITPLLSYINPGEDSKFFLQIVEKDPNNYGVGEIVSYSIIDYSNGVEEIICEQQNVTINNNDTTSLSVIKAVEFDKVQITTESLPVAAPNEVYSYQLDANGGTEPYTWAFKIDYEEDILTGTFPVVNGEQLTPSNNDDGFVTHPLDFSFPFYGQNYEQITILTDGAIVFEEEFKYVRTEESIISNKCIAAYCADLMIYPEQDDGIWYEGDETGAIIKFRTSKYDEPWVFVETAIKLFPNGEIEFYYGTDITEGLEWAAGVSYGDGSSYTISQLSNSYAIPDDYSTKFICPEFPAGMQISSDGVFYGTPTQGNTSWNITFKATDYSSVFSLKTLEFVTLMVDIEKNINSNKLLLSNIPNPFSENTNISFEMQNDEFVSISIYNLSGQLIKTICNGKPLTKGKHSFLWNGNNGNGVQVENGIYYCVLSCADFTETVKIIKVP